jgi:hypothetical protein
LMANVVETFAMTHLIAFQGQDRHYPSTIATNPGNRSPRLVESIVLSWSTASKVVPCRSPFGPCAFPPHDSAQFSRPDAAERLCLASALSLTHMRNCPYARSLALECNAVATLPPTSKPRIECSMLAVIVTLAVEVPLWYS